MSFVEIESCKNQRFGRTFRLSLQGRKALRAKESVSSWITVNQLQSFSFVRRHFYPESEGDTLHQNHRFSQDLHGATPQKTAFFIVIALKTLSLT
jgi:hypothetical protein